MVSGGGPLTSQMLQKAEEVVQQHAEKYIERAQDQIDALVEVVQEAEAETGDKEPLYSRRYFCRRTTFAAWDRHSAIRW